MNFTNQEWVARLSGRGADHDVAVTLLRGLLVRNLRRALPGGLANDDAFIDDMTQEAMLRILGRLSQFEGRSRFLTWATSVAVHVAISERRRRQWKNRSLEDVTVWSPQAPSTMTDADDAARRIDIIRTMYQIIENHLTDRQRVVLLAELRGVPQDELVRLLGTNRNALYKLAHDARKRLKQRLEDAGFRAEDIQAAFAA